MKSKQKISWVLFIGYLLAGTFFIASSAMALQSRKIAATGGAPIPTAYSSSNTQSLVWSTANTGNKHLHINNTTSSEVACIFSADDSTAAPADSGTISESLLIPASTQYVFDSFSISKRAYCRSNSGSTITSGSVYIHVW